MPLKKLNRRWPQMDKMGRAGNARRTKVPTGARPWLDWINFSARFYLRSSASICGYLRLKGIVPA